MKKTAAQVSDPKAQRLALGGVIGPILFVAAITVAGLIRPGYSPIHTAISGLGVGKNAWLEDVAAFLLGLSTIVFTVGFARIMRSEMSGAARRASAFLFTIYGLVWITVSIFTSKPSTRPIHTLASMLGEICVTAALFVVAAGLKSSSRWQRWARYSRVAAYVTVLLVIFTVLASSGRRSGSISVGGLAERLLVVEVLIWFVAFGWAIARNRSRI
jgi:hypothetical membrane protein